MTIFESGIDRGDAIAQTNHTLAPNERIWNLAVGLLIFCTLAAILSRTYADPDLWGHMRFGLDLLHNRSIPQVDAYSYLTTGKRWINHNWLAELNLALAWQVGTSAGLVLLKVSMGLLVYALLAWHLRQRGVPWLRVGILLMLASFQLSPITNTIRPQMFALLLLTVELVILYQAELGRYRWLWNWLSAKAAAVALELFDSGIRFSNANDMHLLYRQSASWRSQ